MTACGLWGRRPAARKGAGAFIGQAGQAVKSGVSHVTSLRGLSLWQRFLVACSKIVAILGYHYGKWTATTKAVATNGKQRASPDRGDLEAAIDAALAGCARFSLLVWLKMHPAAPPCGVGRCTEGSFRD